MAHYFLKTVHSFIQKFWFVLMAKMDQFLPKFNLKKVIYSTGFYSPPVIKIEAYKYSQLSMKSSAAETRGFRCMVTLKMAKNGLILMQSLPFWPQERWPARRRPVEKQIVIKSYEKVWKSYKKDHKMYIFKSFILEAVETKSSIGRKNVN